MSFKVSKGNKFLEWDNGKVSGPMAKAVTTLSTLWDNRGVGPEGGPYTYTDHLKSDISTAMLVRAIYGDRGLEWFGDVPHREGKYDLIE